MKIKVLSVESDVINTKKGQQAAVKVSYTNLDSDKQGSTKIPVWSKDLYETLKGASEGSVYDVKVEKNGDFYNWVSATSANGDAKEMTSKTGPTPAPRSNFETPEERAQRQVYIARQSSLDRAMQYFAASQPKGLTASPDEIIELAVTFTDFIMNGHGPDSLNETEVE